MDTHVHQNIPLPIFMQSEPTKSPSRHQVEFSMSLVNKKVVNFKSQQVWVSISKLSQRIDKV